MSGVSFNEERTPAPLAPSAKQSFLVRLVLSSGVARTQREAEIVLLVIALLVILLAGFLAFSSMAEDRALDNADIERIIELQRDVNR